MCYTGGPRCSGHVGNEVAFAQAKLNDAKAKHKGNDHPEVYEAYQKLETLEREYNSTPTGQKALLAEIDAFRKEGDEVEAENLEVLQMAAHSLREHDMEQRSIRLGRGEKVTSACKRPPESKTEAHRIHRMDIQHGVNLPTIPVKDAPSTGGKKQLVDVAPSTTVYSDYDASLVPQANNISKISSIVESINSGANTSSSIAESLEMQDRQGHYYANAAVYLGLATKHESSYEGGGHEYQLTENGITVLSSDPAERAGLVRNMVNSTPLMRVYHESDRNEESVKEAIREMGLDEGTIDRRTKAVISWDNTVNAKSFVYQLNTVHTQSGERSKLAAANLEQVRKERKLKEQNNEARGGFCEKHGTMRTTAGICFECQDD